MATMNVNRVIGEAKFTLFHWLLFAACIIIISFDGYDLVVYGAAVPVLMKEWGLNPAYAGVLGSYALFGAAVGALTFGPLADKIGRRKVILICVALFSLAMGFAGMSSSPTIFGIFRFFAGVGIGGCMPNIVALATEWSPAGNRAMMVTAIYNGMQIGGILAAVIAMWFLPVFGWRAIFLFGAVTLVLLPLLAKWLPEAPGALVSKNRIAELREVLHKARPDLTVPEDTVFETDKAAAKSPIAALFQENRAVSSVLFWIIYFMTMYMIYGLNIWLPKLMMNAGFELGSGLWFLLTLNLGSIVGCIICGIIADRIGSKKMVTILYFLAFVSITMLSIKTNFYVLTLLVAIAGTCSMAAMNVAHGYVSLYYPPQARSTALGLAFGLGRFGAILGPTIVGVLLSADVTLFQSFLGISIPGLLAFVAILLVPDKYSFTKNIGKG